MTRLELLPNIMPGKEVGASYFKLRPGDSTPKLIPMTRYVMTGRVFVRVEPNLAQCIQVEHDPTGRQKKLPSVIYLVTSPTNRSQIRFPNYV